MNDFYLTDKIINWSRAELVRFALHCHSKVKYPMCDESLKVIELAKRWLEDQSSVSKEELSYVHPIINIISGDLPYSNAVVIAYKFATYDNVEGTLDRSLEALYLEYVRGRLSDIMEN